MQDILSGDDPQVTAAVAVIGHLSPDILILSGFDGDARLQALRAFADVLRGAGLAYPHLYAPPGNAGLPTGQDADGDGQTGGPADNQGWGRFPGAGGMAVLSRLPLRADLVQDHSGFLWADLPGALLPPGADPAVMAVQRLASHAHVALPVDLPQGRLTLLLWHATPPVFDGTEDRNGRRNHDEAAFWRLLLDGALPLPRPEGPLVLAGTANLDPADGDGRPAALRALLSHPALQDPRPRGTSGRSDPGQSGDPALDTAHYDRLGGLRLAYVLPSADLRLRASGVLWPAPDDPLAAPLAAASNHHPVWVDLILP